MDAPASVPQMEVGGERSSFVRHTAIAVREILEHESFFSKAPGGLESATFQAQEQILRNILRGVVVGGSDVLSG